jgi:tripartite-type tricarboxylate transporter receptor subunit TctC
MLTSTVRAARTGFPRLLPRAIAMRLAAIVLVAGVATPGPAQAQVQADFPRAGLRIIVPFAAGGAPDIVARLLGQKAAESLGREVVVENRVGAGGNIGFEAGARAVPDGHTLLMCTFGCATNPALFDRLGWAPKDLAPVMLAGRVPNVLVVHPGVKARSTAEFIALAKARPGTLTMASSGVGSASHLAGEQFNAMAGIEVVHVPYKGSTAALPDIAGGRVDFMIVSVPEALAYLRDGRLLALGTSSTRRASSLPDVPTLAESGLPGYAVTAWSMLVVPAATPEPVIRRLNQEFNAALADPAVRKRLDELSIEPGGGPPADAARFLREQSAEWEPLIRARGIRAN